MGKPRLDPATLRWVADGLTTRAEQTDRMKAACDDDALAVECRGDTNEASYWRSRADMHALSALADRREARRLRTVATRSERGR